MKRNFFSRKLLFLHLFSRVRKSIFNFLNSILILNFIVLLICSWTAATLQPEFLGLRVVYPIGRVHAVRLVLWIREPISAHLNYPNWSLATRLL